MIKTQSIKAEKLTINLTFQLKDKSVKDIGQYLHFSVQTTIKEFLRGYKIQDCIIEELELSVFHDLTFSFNRFRPKCIVKIQNISTFEHLIRIIEAIKSSIIKDSIEVSFTLSPSDQKILLSELARECPTSDDSESQVET